MDSCDKMIDKMMCLVAGLIVIGVGLSFFIICHSDAPETTEEIYYVCWYNVGGNKYWVDNESDGKVEFSWKEANIAKKKFLELEGYIKVDIVPTSKVVESIYFYNESNGGQNDTVEICGKKLVIESK